MKPLRERQFLGVASDLRPLVSRVRFQLLAGLLLCVFLPWFFRIGAELERTTSATANNAAIGAAISFVVGYYFFRQLGVFPGVKAGANTLVSISVPFAVMAVVFLLLRLEYSRFIFAASFVLSVMWLVGLQTFMSRTMRPTIAIVPGGQADDLANFSNAQWKTLSQPPQSLDAIEAVAADLRHDLDDAWERFLVACSLNGKPVYHSKHLMESLTGKVQIEHMSENSFGSLLPNLAYLKIKQIIDWLAALFFLPAFLLIYLIVAPLIIVSSGFPAMFVQERIGYRGERFKVYKFRTMTSVKPSADESDHRQAAMTKERDHRVTRIGRVLRKYRIDELPQILNILKGEMSWIGPRPEAITLSKWYEAELAFYPYRHVVKPGISGWAQVNQGHVTSTDQVLEKLHYDFFYIKYLSPWLDLLIVLRTIRAMLTGFGAR